MPSLPTILGFAAFNMLVTVVYLVLAVRTVWQIAHDWRSLVDQTYTDHDEDLAKRVGFLLLTPLGVLLHELAHFWTAQYQGAQHLSLTFLAYWGFVTYSPLLGPIGDFWVAVAGPAMSLVIGFIAACLAVWLRPRWQQHVFQSFSFATLGLVLVMYPAMSYMFKLGDFVTIYTTRQNLSVAVGCVHALSLLVFLVITERVTRRDHLMDWADMQHAAPDVGWRVSDQDLERLRVLELSWTRFLPGTRQELVRLRLLRDWVVEQNRQTEEANWILPPTMRRSGPYTSDRRSQ